MPRPAVPVLLLPGLEGSGDLFARFVASGSRTLDLRVLRYPRDRPLGYAELGDLVRAHYPRNRPFVLLGESFSGPLALRLARERPRWLAGVVLAASFHRRPAPPWLAALRPLGPVFFGAPLPAHAVRLLLAGGDGPAELVREVQAAVAAVRARVLLRRAHDALDVDATEALRDCPVPLLVLAGREDRLLRPRIPGEIRAIRPDAEVVELDAPHLLLQRQPEVAMSHLESFVARVARPAVPAPA